jgi:hypothetical protein
MHNCGAQHLGAVFPHECQVVLQVISQVFDHDEQACQEQLRPEARLAYHQAQSQPLMDELKRWLDTQMNDHLVEPNSALGKAIGSMLSHSKTLTRFLSVPGAPLDNDLAERALKLCIRQRKNSLFYQSPHSAYIASVLTSLIATCLYAGVNSAEPPGCRAVPGRVWRLDPRGVGECVRQGASGSGASAQTGPPIGRVGGRHATRRGFS